MATLVFTDENFEEEVLKSTGFVLVDFWAPWCAPCKMIAPLIDDLEKEYEGKLKVGKLDTDKNMKVSIQFSITSLPSIFIFKDGKKVNSQMGVTTKQKLKDFVEKTIAEGK